MSDPNLYDVSITEAKKKNGMNEMIKESEE